MVSAAAAVAGSCKNEFYDHPIPTQQICNTRCYCALMTFLQFSYSRHL